MKTLYNFKRWIFLSCCVFGFLMMPKKGLAEDVSLEEVTLDECGGYVTFKFKVHRQSWCGTTSCLNINYQRRLSGDNYVYFETGGNRYDILRIKGGDHGGRDWYHDDWDCEDGVSFFKIGSYQTEDLGMTERSSGDISGCLNRNNTHVVKVKFLLTKDLYGKALAFGIRGKMEGYQNDGSNDNFDNGGNMVFVPMFPEPIGLRATAQCGKVFLEWSKPNLVCSSAKYEIRRNATTSLSTNVDANAISFTDNGVPFSIYNYEVRLRLPAAVGSLYSDWISVSGSPIKDVTIPNAVRVTQPNCAQTAPEIQTRVEWSADPTNLPDRFIVQRSTNPGFSSMINTIVTRDRTYYDDDEPFNYNTQYYYRIKAENTTCNTDATSLIKSIVIDGVPNQPVSVTTTLLPDNTIRVAWNHTGQRVKGFTIVRSPLDVNGTSRQETFNLSTLTSYIDDYLPNCALYQYEVKANSRCFDPVGSANRPQVVFSVNDITTTFGPGALKTSKGYYPDKVKLQWDYSNNKAIDNFIIYRRPLGSTFSFEILQRVAAPTNNWEDKSGSAGQLYEYGVVAEVKNCGGGPLYSNSHPSLGDGFKTVGFRSPTGLINGKISYNGGIALEGAKVVAAKASSSKLGTSLQFDGSSTAVKINNLNNPNTGTWLPAYPLAISLWVKPASATPNMAILSNGSSYSMKINTTGVKNDTSFVFKSDTVRWLAKGSIFGKINNDTLYSPDESIIKGLLRNDSLLLLEKTFVEGIIDNDTLYNANKTIIRGIVAKDIVYGHDTLFSPVTSIISKPVNDRLYAFMKNDTLFSPDRDSIYAFVVNDTVFRARYVTSTTRRGAIYGSIANNQIFPVESPANKRYIYGNRITNQNQSTVYAFLESDTLYYANYGLGTVPVKGARFAIRAGNIIYHLVNSISVSVIKDVAYGKLVNDTIYAISNPALVIQIKQGDDIYKAIYQNTAKIVRGSIMNWIEKGTLFTINRQLMPSLISNDTLYTAALAYKGGLTGDTIFSNKAIYVKESSGKLFGIEHFQTLNAVTSISGITPKSTYTVVFETTIGATLKQVSSQPLKEEDFTNITVSYDGSELKLFANGEPQDSMNATGNISYSPDPFILGGVMTGPNTFTNHFSGKMDEVIMWNTTLTNKQIKQNYGRYLIGNEQGIAGYWRMDENAGNRVYDASSNDSNDENSKFNKHDGLILGNVGWSDNVPDPELLGFAGFTNEKGDYTIPAIRFAGTGENFKIVPVFKTHEFDPSNTVLFIGEGAVVQNNINFIDKSSFKVTGFVKVDPLAFGYTARNAPGAPSCFIEGAFVKIDGNFVVQNSRPVQTDSKGKFEMRVPIGEHSISIEKPGHTFSLGKWPVNTQTHDFQEDVSGITFYDSTNRIVVGKVVGGKDEGDKFPGFGKSKNNLGKASIHYISLGNECFGRSVKTNPNSGEYIISLPPLKFRIDTLKIKTQDNGFNASLKGLADEILDLAASMPDTGYTKRDTTFIVPGGSRTTNNIVSIAKVNYHLRKDYVYQAKPKIVITDQDDNEFIGDTNFRYVDPLQVNDDIYISLRDEPKPFIYPIFHSGTRYTMHIHTTETYKNTDKDSSYSYNVKDAGIDIKNDVAGNNIKMSLHEGDTLYSFLAGNPNVLHNGAYSFLKTLQIYGPAGSTWEPGSGSTPFDKSFKGYVLGSTQKGALDFMTRPDLEPVKMVDFILRDPPGGRSKTTLKRASKHTTFWEYGYGAGFSSKVTDETGLAISLTPFVTGLETKTKASVELAIEGKVSTTGKFGHETTIITKQDISTNGDAYRPGAPSDLFVGTGINILYGLSDILAIIPASQCALGGVVCVGPTISGMRLGKKEKYTVSPEKNYATQFFYTAEHIEIELQGLVKKRNALLNDGVVYSSNLPLSNPLYGSNNNDPELVPYIQQFFPQLAGLVYDGYQADSGVSYVYRRRLDPSTVKGDLVRSYNTQIDLWKQILAFNEREKLEARSRAVAGTSKFKNFSFGYGSSISNSSGSETSDKQAFTFEMEGSETFTTLTDLEGGVKITFELELGVTQEFGSENGTKVDSSTTWDYELEEDDFNDQVSVDVIESHFGNGPVFVTKAGRTSCPHEPLYISKYYQPGRELSGGTIPRDQPSVRVTPSIITNIPADGIAVFQVEFGNLNREDSVRKYTMQFDTRTNAGSAALRIDGKSLALKLEVPIQAGQSITKPLTIQRGPVDYNYDNIKLLLYSGCQFNFGTNLEKNIYDSAYVSVHFLPTCTKSDFESPNTRWILNNSFNDTLGLALGGYDINFPGLKDLRLQFKQTAQSDADWLTWNTFWKPGHPERPADNPTDSIPTERGNIDYNWVVSQLTDGEYDLRLQTTCLIPESPKPVKVISSVITGVIDRINPHPFGTPSPGDGILSPNDDITVRFNEDIDAGKLTWDNFDVRGVLNGSSLRHGASIYFAGSADSYMKIDGLLLQSKSFTIEFWAKRKTVGDEIVLAQGALGTPEMFVGFDASNKLKFSLDGNVVASTNSFADEKWHHYAVSYDYDENKAVLYADGALLNTFSNFVAAYRGDGSIYVGKRNFQPFQPFKGHIHELRIWKKAMPLTDIIINLGKKMSGREMGLAGNWSMDEAGGKLAQDLVHSRHGQVNAEWAVEPASKAMNFSGTTTYIEAKGAAAAFTQEMDFTIEFWFKASAANNVTLLSNGKGDQTDSSATDWAIGTDAMGKIIVANDGKTFAATDSNFFDNTWHHFALVVNRIGNLNAFVDGQLQNSTTNTGWKGFGGAQLWMGVKGWYIGNTKNFDNHYEGSLDEVRIWGLARRQEQIKTDMHHRLAGNEFGLASYYPFEAYQEDAAGIMLLEQTLINQQKTKSDTARSNGSAYSDDTPKIKLQRPVEKVNFIYSVNKDQVIITSTDEPWRIENCVLDITLRNIQDLRANKMQSPVTWTAYIDKNQVVWADQEREFRKKLYDPLGFEATVSNQGGNEREFTIDNLPLWLKAEPETGKIAPNSNLKIKFTINEGLNIGKYDESIHLRTSFGFNEILSLKLQVYEPAPENWVVNPANFQFSMSMIGQLKVDDIISTDPEDKIAAFVGEECRGVASLNYIDVYDTYQAYINIYSNINNGEDVKFRIWDASAGQVLTNVTPIVATVPNYNFTFESNKVWGSTSKPVVWNSVNGILKTMELPKGWKWISFNLASNALSRSSLLFKESAPNNGNELKGMINFDTYDSTAKKWIGNLAGDNLALRAGGLRNEESYKVKLNKPGVLNFRGTSINPSSKPISLIQGWNWIGFISQYNMEVNEALATLNPTEGDVLKSQYQFAIYDPVLKWVGSLKFMIPGEGYMMKSAQAATLTYPRSGLVSARMAAGKQWVEDADWKIDHYNYPADMSLVAQIVNDTLIDEGDKLAAFADGICRGIATPVYDPAKKRSLFFMNIYGNNDDKKMTFKLKKSGSKTYDIVEPAQFKANDMEGTLAKPYRLSVIKTDSVSIENIFALVNLSPNPFTKNLKIEFPNPHKNLSIKISNVLGTEIRNLTDDLKLSATTSLVQLNWDGKDKNGADVTGGTYIINITIGDASVNKLVVKF